MWNVACRPKIGGAPPWLPPSLSGLELWLRADSLSLSNNDPVSQWNDESGNGLVFEQAVTAAKPTFIDPGLNGLPIVDFDGGDYLTESIASWLSGVSSGLVYAVVLHDAVGGWPDWLTSATTAAGTPFIRFGRHNGYQPRVNAHNGATSNDVRMTSVVGAGTWNLVELHSTGSVYTYVLNGSGELEVVVAGGNNGRWFSWAGVRNNVSIGALVRTSVQSQWSGRIAEILVYSDYHDATLRALPRAYLTAKWGL